ncbi:Os06g0703700, partial [Oryza sativa Japonica Group]
DVGGHGVHGLLLQLPLGVHLARPHHGEPLRRRLVLLPHLRPVAHGEVPHPAHRRLVAGVVRAEPPQRETVGPPAPAEARQHPLLPLLHPVADGERVVVPPEAVDERHRRRPRDGADVRRGLPRLAARGAAEHHRHVVDEAERVHDHLPLDALHRVDHHGDGARVQLLEALLRGHVGAGEPAAEAGVGVVPPHHHLRPPRLPEHLQHLALERVVHRLHAHAGAALRHGEHVGDRHRVLVDELAQHQPHHLHRHAGSPVLEHLEEGEGGHVDLLRRVRLRLVAADGGHHRAQHVGVHRFSLQISSPRFDRSTINCTIARDIKR